MNAATTGDVYNFTVVNSSTGLAQNLSGFTITCEVVPPANIGGQPYAWPGLFYVVNASTGLVQLVTKPNCFPIGSAAPYYLQFQGNNYAGTIWKSRLFPIQIATSIF